MTRSEKVPPPIPPQPPPIPSQPLPAPPLYYQPTPPPPGISKTRLAVALIVALIADFIEWIPFVAVLPPLIWALDFITALLLFAILGWHWFLLPAMIAEAIPGIALFPSWALVVVSIGITGRIKRFPSPR